MMDDFVGKLVADKYRIDTLIREGDSGDLYTGRHEMLDKPVMVRILPRALAVDARWVRAFIDEARTAAAVSAPNLLNVTDFGTDAKGVTYEVFEETSVRTLRDVLRETPTLTESRALNIAQRIASGISAAHEIQIIHGSLDPDKVFIETANDGRDTVKVIGIGRDPAKAGRDTDARYLAPEQTTAFPAADMRSDVYSLAVMLYEMLSGSIPNGAAAAVDGITNEQTELPAPLTAFRRDLHPDLEPILLSALASDPARRYRTMKAFAEDLSLLSGEDTGNTKVEAAAAAAGPKRNIWQTAFIVLAGISVLAGALIYATSVRRTDPTTQLQADADSLPVQPIGPATGAQEESLAKLPPMTDAEMMSATAMEQPPGTLPGGDGYNAWANGGIPPAGAPLNPYGGQPGSYGPPMQYVQPGGQVYTIDPNGGSQFMPNDSGVILVPVPANTAPAAKPDNPKTAANTAVEPNPKTEATPKPMATPPPKTEKPVSDATKKEKPASKPKAGKTDKPVVPSGQDELD